MIHSFYFGGVNIAKKWDWPLKGLTAHQKSISSFANDQLFGARGSSRPNGFHDGLDYGNLDHTGNPANKIYCAHFSKVKEIAYASGYEWYVITEDNDGVYCMYQEFASNKSDIVVSVGDTLHVGTFIGTRTTNHLHLGINTKKYPTKADPWSMDGWVDPLQTIIDDKLGSADDGKGGDDSDNTSSTTTKTIIMINQYTR